MRAPEPESFASQVILKCSIWQISTVYTMAVPAHYLAPNYMQESQKTFTLGFDMKCSSYILQKNTGVQGWITKFLKGIRLYFSLWLSILSNEILLVKITGYLLSTNRVSYKVSKFQAWSWSMSSPTSGASSSPISNRFQRFSNWHSNNISLKHWQLYQKQSNAVPFAKFRIKQHTIDGSRADTLTLLGFRRRF